MTNIVSLKVRDGERVRWAMAALIDHGEAGVTPLDVVGPRWSSYVHKLRRDGFVIETVEEKHGGPFAGLHARYVLKSPVAVIERVAA